MYTDTLLKKYSLISDQVDARELRVLLLELEKLLQAGKTGAIVEFGCYAGTTSLFIRRLLDHYQSSAVFHVYDSFEGLPPKTSRDMSVAGDQFRTGELAASKKEFMLHFKKAGLTLPVIHKGWFQSFAPADVPPGIMFAFLDGDYYESIRDSFALITPKLLDEAIIIVDDYANEALPGAARATDEWRSATMSTLQVQASLALVHYRSPPL
jgi:O-methyltransferase